MIAKDEVLTMLLTRHNGNFPALRLRHDVDRLFSDFVENFWQDDGFGEVADRVFPPLNIWEDERTLFAEAELPGMKLGDVEVLVLGDELIVKGERKQESQENATYHRRERGVGAFSRVVRLPVAVDADKVSAGLRDGVLTITLPKAETAVPRKIQVKGC